MKNPDILTLVLLSVFIGISYAGVVNIMLNGLGIVLSPKDNPGYLPGMNAGAFNLGAGLSFAIIYAVMGVFNVNPSAISSSANHAAADASSASVAAVDAAKSVIKLVPSSSSYMSSMVVGAILLVFALLCSICIPRSED